MWLNRYAMRRLAVLIAFAVGLSWLLYHVDIAGRLLGVVWGLLYPFAVGLVFAYLVNIPMKQVEKRLSKKIPPRLKRVVSFGITVLALLALAALVVFLVVPQLVQSAILLGSAMPDYFKRVQDWLAPYLDYWPTLEGRLRGLDLDWKGLASSGIDLLRSGSWNLLTSAAGLASSLLGGIGVFFVAAVFATALLFAKEPLLRQLTGFLKAYLPDRAFAWIEKVGRLANHTFSRYVAGQGIMAVAVGIITGLALWIARVDYALLIGVLSGIFSLIPIFGAWIAGAIGLFLTLVSGGLWQGVLFLAVFLVVQQVAINIIYPRIVRGSVGLSTPWVLVATAVGGGLFGIVGILFILPLVSVIYALVRENAKMRLKNKENSG